MDVMIIVKWLTNYEGNESNAPYIVTQMINLFLSSGEIDGSVLWGTEESFMALENNILIISALCIPTMLLVKPFYLKTQMKKTHKKKSLGDYKDDEEAKEFMSE